MLLEITNNQLINNRVIQTIIICIFSMLFCQVLKFIIISIRNKDVNWNILYSTGGFPSSH
jgi:acid phosphatase family membrane protein YuiD